jgi:hypothetical protein
MTLIIKNPTSGKIRFKKDTVATTDTNISNVSLLLHGDGTNGSTTIIDTSYSPKTITAFGDAKISTAQSKFGGASLAFDGNSYVQTVSSPQLSQWSTDFTFEFWIYFNTISSTRNVDIWTNSTSVSDGMTAFYVSTLGAARSLAIGRMGINETRSSANQVTTGIWYHIATVRSGSNLSVYKDGTSIISVAVGSFLETTTQKPLTIGNSFQGGSFNIGLDGYIDELRITKHIARYTSNFTPPTAPFPDF